MTLIIMENNNNSTIMIKLISLLLSLSMMMTLIVQTEGAIIPSSQHHSVSVSVAGEDALLSNPFKGKGTLTKRSIGGSDDGGASSAYAGHSIMRFGRAPHNIMHFGKRSMDDQQEPITGLMDSEIGLGTEENRQIRYVLVPMAYYGPGSSRPLSKKSVDNLESTRGVFMHFG